MENSTDAITAECTHTQRLDNDREGESVCVECGLVLEQLYETKQYSEQTVLDHAFDSTIYSFISDVCDRGHISLGIRQHSQTLCAKFFQKHPNHCKGEKKFAAAVCAIYTALAEQKNPRSIEEICYFSGVSINAVWNVQKLFKIDIPDCTANYVDRVCAQIGMAYSDTLVIKKIVHNMSGSCGVKTTTLLASAIYMYNKTIKLNQICRVCLVTPSSVHKFISRIEPKYRKNISLLI